MKSKKIVFAAFCFLSVSLTAMPQVKQTRAIRTDSPPTVDGSLDEPAWLSAPIVGGFIQFEPSRGNPVSLKTEVKILYDGEHVYFGFLCFDPEPDKIAAHLPRRDDDLLEDDSVYVCIDTFNDKRSCYYFMTNLLGTQTDGRITENGRTTDNTWDGIWKSAAGRTEDGWSAEIAVSFESIKYSPGTKMTWGLNLGRGIPRYLEYGFWAGPLESPYKVSQYGELIGLDLEKSKKKAQIIPHVLAKLEKDKPSQFDAGIDARYAFSQMISGNLTINPDFATIEADQEQVNLTRFELRLQEMRNFFLEGSEIYSQRIRLFYSRRISDIYGGIKVYGKSGGYEFSALSAQTRADEEMGTDSANFSAFRLKRDVMKSSNVGFTLANKLTDDVNRGTAGFDTALNFSDRFNFTGQFAMSYGDQNRDNVAFFLRPSYDTATFHIHLRYTQLGRNFGDNANSVGYIQDDNRRELDSAMEKTFYIQKGGFERIGYQSNYNIYWGLNGTLRSWQIDQSLEFDLKNKFSFEVKHQEEYKLYEKKFRNRETAFQLGYNTREWQAASVTYSFGRNYDSDFYLVEGRVNAKLTPALSLSYGLIRLHLNPDPENESTWIHVIRATQYFTNDLFFKLFYQINSVIDKKNIQLLFVYRFQPPFGMIQLAYQKGTARFGEKGIQGDTLFVKFSFMF
ncbi:MAG: carbohydrate binding family 9 domain-containing protein [Candidatus Aminicenantes bacterium]|nr:carbohydrate binding family 9 domain-containing protein [Candidatus Aminicenantes bacterium]